MKKLRIDKPLLISIIILAIGGFFIFSSASLGLLAREGSRFSNVAFNQTFYGLFLGAIAFLITSKIPYQFWKKYALFFFGGAIILTALVFVPQLGFEHGGARRWVSFGSFSFQPAEFLKIGFIMYWAAWIANIKQGIQTFAYGFLPFVITLGVVGGLLLSQPDTDTFFVICTAGLAMFIVGGGRWRYVGLAILCGIIAVILLLFSRPYLAERITTFINPNQDSLGSSYQIQQSLIAVGTGGITGRGFGKSIQKFNFLPEPIGDSIFAVAAEEFGMMGGIGIIGMFLFFAFRGLKIAGKSQDSFGGLMAVGIVILILSQALVNIASMLNVFPLSGIPLPFISHGGTALLVTLAVVGILINISKHQKSA